MNNSGKRAILGWLLVIVLYAGSVSFLARSHASSSEFVSQAPQPTAARRIGAIKSINGNVLTLTSDSSSDVGVTVQPTTRVLRIAPGEKDLKNATPIQLQDLQVGDRILVGGKASDDNLSIVAATVVVMTRSDLEARHQKDLQDWQKRGVDGLATAVDAAARTVTISARSRNMIVHVSTNTIIRRYAPDSARFDDAKPSTLAEIHPGDQVRARGERTSDGGEVKAEEIVSGSFRNVAATVNSIDAKSSTMNLHDLLAKKTVVVKVTPDSLLRRLSPEMAERIALRLKKTAVAGAQASSTTGSSTQNQTSGAAGASGKDSGEGEMARRSGGAGDLQQMLSRLPAVSLADLKKGDAVILLSTEGTNGGGTVVTLLTGVEPILRAAPGAISASILTPWSLSAPSGDAVGP